MNNEELNKSIDSMLDELFSEEAPIVEKSIDIAKDADTKADAAISKAPASQSDESRGAGRPKQISDVPKNDQDGKRAGSYDKDIKENDDKEEENEEAKKQSKEKNQIKKSIELTETEYAEYQELKKAQEATKIEELKKAEDNKVEDLIKSVIEKTSVKYEAKIEELTKSLSEQGELVKAMAKQPKTSKSITNIEALEKSGTNESQAPESFSKSDMLDAAESLVKSKQISENIVYELDMTGYVYDSEARKLIERELKKR